MRPALAGPLVNAGCKRNAECGINKEPQIRNLQSANRNGNGFTLIEVLLAVSILAFIVSVVYMSFSTTGRSVEQAEAIRDSTDLARTLLIKMSDEIANAYVIPYNTTNVIPTIFFGKKDDVGTGGETLRHDSLSLTTLTNWRRMNSKETDLWEVGYFFKEKADGTGYVLMRREKRELSKDVPALEGGIEYEITDKVASLQFRYSSDGTTWYDEWDSRTKSNPYPRIVELGLKLESEETYTMRVGVRQF
jgi:prepilin-type N-terminal cleavage/methylation domain-containing protein